MVFDSAVFVLTVYRSATLWRQGGRGIVHVVMRDGGFSVSGLGQHLTSCWLKVWFTMRELRLTAL